MPRKTLLALPSPRSCALAIVPAAASAQTFNVAVGIGDQSARRSSTTRTSRRCASRRSATSSSGTRSTARASSRRPTRTCNRARPRKHAGPHACLVQQPDDLKAAKLPSVATYRAQGQGARRPLPPAGRADVGRDERGQPRLAADVEQPAARRAVLPRAAPHLPRLHDRRASTSSTSAASSATSAASTARSAAARVARRRSSASTTTRTPTATATRGTRLILRTVKRYNRRAQFWLTETGGVAKFGTRSRATRRTRGGREPPAPRGPLHVHADQALPPRHQAPVHLQLHRRPTAGPLRRRPDAQQRHPRPAYNEVRTQIRRFSD